MKGVKPKLRSIIAVVIAGANYFDQKQVLKGVIAEAQKQNYDVAVFSNIYNLNHTEKELIGEQRIYELVLSEEIDAVVLVGDVFIEHSLKEIIAGLLRQKNVPVILLGESVDEFEGVYQLHVNTSDSADIEALTSHLIEEHGYSVIDLLTGFEGSPISEERAEGYRAALRHHGIEPVESRVHYGDFWYNSGDSLAERYISGELELPQAIVCGNEYMAYGLLRTFADAGIKVPRDVAIAAYEYSDTRTMYTPLLTCYQRNREELGRQAVSAIHEVLSGREPVPMPAPEGRLICGESCPCPRDDAKYIEELKFVVVQKERSFWNIYDKLDEKLTECLSMDELVAAIGETQWIIRYVDNVFLCLFSEWYDEKTAVSDEMICRSIMPWMDTAPFDSERFRFSDIFRLDAKPAAYYFSPLFFHTRLLGHIVLKYGRPDGYDDIFRNWVKSVSNGLEFLRMKNDISFLTKCQSISETRDTMTGLLNEKGLRQAYKSMTSPETDVKLVVLRILLNKEKLGVNEQSEKVAAIMGAAKAVELFCGTHDTAGRSSEKEFVCIKRSSGGCEETADLLSCTLIQNKKYFGYAGIDSFVCSAVDCSGMSFSEAYRACCGSNEEKLRELQKQKTRYNYAKLLEIRNIIYSKPEITLDQEELDRLFFIKRDSMRIAFKKCFGASFHHDCVSARLARAKYYLSATMMKMSDIAELCGYVDNKYFMRQFLQNSGKTASEYRKLMCIAK